MALEVKQLVVGYHSDVWILRGVSLTAQDGKITVVVGPNGAGKSTLLKTIYGYLKPAKGVVFYNGENITGCKPYKLPYKGIAFVPQGRSIFPALTVLENLQLGTWIFRGDRHRVKKEIDRTLCRFPSLQDKLWTRAGLLSGGQQRLLEIARAFLIRPQTMLLDEPSVGLAPIIVKEVYETVRSLCADDRITILLVDQNIKMALQVCDYVYVLNMGTNEIEGPRHLFGDGTDLVKTWLSGKGGKDNSRVQGGA